MFKAMPRNGKDFDKHDPQVQRDAIAWVRGQKSTAEVQERFGGKPVAFTLYRVASVLREAVKAGRWK
jgi:hypothetical protein